MPKERQAPPIPPDAAGRRLISSVRRYLSDDTHDPLERAATARHLSAMLPDLVDEQIDAAHNHGHSWAAIAARLGLATRHGASAAGFRHQARTRQSSQ